MGLFLVLETNIDIRSGLWEQKRLNLQTAGLEELNPERVPSWIRQGEWAGSGTVPVPHSQLCPARCRAPPRAEHGPPPKPSPRDKSTRQRAEGNWQADRKLDRDKESE